MDINENSPKKYRTVSGPGTGQIQEKKSRFIASIVHAGTEEEALSFIADIRRKYPDARHNCFAFCIGPENELERFSDDGEPSRTAGKPMLDVLAGEELRYTAAVVTRYFGGILLGTGGLVRAYQSAVTEGLAHCRFTDMILCRCMRVIASYGALNRVEYICRELPAHVTDAVYEETVRLSVAVRSDCAGRFMNMTAEIPCEEVRVEPGEYAYFSSEEFLKKNF